VLKKTGTMMFLLFSLTVFGCNNPSGNTNPEKESPAPVASQPASPAAPSSPSASAPAVAPSAEAPASPAPALKVSFADVQPIIKNRCSSCHGFSGGVTFDTEAQIKNKASRIKQRAVVSKSMPPGNTTKITDEERALLGRWVDAGAP